MSRLAHSTYGAPGFGPERKALLADLDAKQRLEVASAKAIQKQTGCTWAEAIRVATKTRHAGEQR